MSNDRPFDGVFKMGGVWASAGKDATKRGHIQVVEVGDGIQLSVPDYHAPIMNVAEARSLAGQLLELARRHEVRKGQA